jgi:hypothetical protein
MKKKKQLQSIIQEHTNNLLGSTIQAYFTGKTIKDIYYEKIRDYKVSHKFTFLSKISK